MYLQLKTCPTCKTELASDQYYRNVSSCKKCVCAAEKRRRDNGGKDSAYKKWKNRIKNDYGITDIQYQEMSEAQNNTCAICNELDTQGYRLAIDHCHNTGKVRGLLCRKCNLAIGHLKDDIKLLESAINYLKSHKNSP